MCTPHNEQGSLATNPIFMLCWRARTARDRTRPLASAGGGQNAKCITLHTTHTRRVLSSATENGTASIAGRGCM